MGNILNQPFFGKIFNKQQKKPKEMKKPEFSTFINQQNLLAPPKLVPKVRKTLTIDPLQRVYEYAWSNTAKILTMQTLNKRS